MLTYTLGRHYNISNIMIKKEKLSYQSNGELFEWNIYTDKPIHSYDFYQLPSYDAYDDFIIYQTSEYFSIINKETQENILRVSHNSLNVEISKSEKLVAYTVSKYIFEKSYLYIRNIYSNEILSKITIKEYDYIDKLLFVSDSTLVYTAIEQHEQSLKKTKIYIYNINTKRVRLLKSYNYYLHSLSLVTPSLLFIGISHQKYMLIDYNGNVIVENNFSGHIHNCTVINDYLIEFNYLNNTIRIVDLFTNSIIANITDIKLHYICNQAAILLPSHESVEQYEKEYKVSFSDDFILIVDEKNNLKLINPFYFKEYIDFFLNHKADCFIPDDNNKSVYAYGNNLIQHSYSLNHLIETKDIDTLNKILNSRIKFIYSQTILLLLKSDLNSVLEDVLLKISNKKLFYKKTGEEFNVLLMGLEKYNLSVIQVSIDNGVTYQEIIKNRNFLNVIRMERIDILKLFLKEDYYRNILYNESLFILSKCINFNSLKTLKYLVENNYVKVSPALLDGNSLVHLIACQNRYEAAKIIIPLFAKNDLKMTNKNGNTAMDIAIKNKDTDTIKLLSTYGVKIPLLYKLFKI